jgi:hypothetical protein
MLIVSQLEFLFAFKFSFVVALLLLLLFGHLIFAASFIYGVLLRRDLKKLEFDRDGLLSVT